MRDHAVALAAFKNDILALSSAGKLANVVDDDHVLELRTFSNIARALDLYLALENAYKHWDYAEWNNSNSQVLLNFQQKFQLFGHFNNRLLALREDHVYGRVVFIAQTPIPEHIFEPGNRPLKGFLALGYASFATQNVGLNNYEYQEVLSWWTKARDAGSSPTSNNRNKKWMFQTDNGQRFWAEGAYYLNFALSDVLPFWHAVRANNLLGSVSDPFNNSWFLNPVEWLADTSTPDGLTVPLDDGNKHSISAAPLLRWSSVYGNATVGMKFNHIYETKNSYFDLTPTSSPLKELYRHGFQTYLIELAMPKTNNAISIDYNIVDSSEQQFVLRNTDSHDRNHFLLLNTEHGKAITRGEGHEQADQLQFLYYVNEESIFADAGYDKGEVLSNSSWNKFYFNNGLSFSNHNDGGLPSPYLFIPELRKASDHNESFDRFFLDHGKIQVMSAKNVMDHYTVISQKFNSQYARSILFIEEDVSNNVPNYVIDFNTNIRGHLSYAESIRHTVSLRYIVGVPQAVSTSYNNWNTFNFNSGK
jgi:hypothetical protein